MIDTPIKPVALAATLGAEVRRVAGALLDEAVLHATNPERNGREKAVHEARKRIKELRALLRLVQSSLVGEDGRRVRDAENDACRAAANGLGAARDAAVRIETLDGLKKRFESELSPEAFGPLRAALVEEHERLATCGGESAGDGDGVAVTAHPFETARGILSAARERVERWRIRPSVNSPVRVRAEGKADAEAWSAIEPNLERLYRRGRRAMRAASRSADVEGWHDWRRRAKDLRYALELLREAAPALLGGAAESAKALTDDLGEDHDLSVLLAFAGEHATACDAESLAALTALADRRRAHLQGRAKREGALLYAERPGAFTDRLRRYWQAAAAVENEPGNAPL